MKAKNKYKFNTYTEIEEFCETYSKSFERRLGDKFLNIYNYILINENKRQDSLYKRLVWSLKCIDHNMKWEEKKEVIKKLPLDKEQATDIYNNCVYIENVMYRKVGTLLPEYVKYINLYFEGLKEEQNKKEPI